jgi:hypothetical protein
LKHFLTFSPGAPLLVLFLPRSLLFLSLMFLILPYHLFSRAQFSSLICSLSSLGRIIWYCDLKYHLDIDDSHLYLQPKFLICIPDLHIPSLLTISTWVFNRHLKLCVSKTSLPLDHTVFPCLHHGK